ncbi:MAG: hypothetical protein M3Q39_05495 [Actinomycetota bacterium]|nr:hypothetical protein [Actinomycetota bacterium]
MPASRAMVLKTPSQPLNVGRSRRTLNSALRRALVVRARGVLRDAWLRPPRELV